MDEQTEAPPQPESLASPKFQFAAAYNFRLRLHTGGPFAGQSLWELTRMDEDGKEIRIVSDADKLENCLDNLIGELQRDGY